MEVLCPIQFKEDHKNDIPVFEALLALNILLYDIDSVDGNKFGELAGRSVQKYEITVRLLRYNNQTRYVSNNNAVFQFFVVLFLSFSSKNSSILSDFQLHALKE